MVKNYPGEVLFEKKVEELNKKKIAIPSWFQIDTKIGVTRSLVDFV